MDKKALLKKWAECIGIDVIGFTSCLPLDEIEGVLEDREKSGYLSGFEEKDIQKRIKPSLIMEDCETIISAGISYNVDINTVKQRSDYKHKSYISRTSWGTDYHIVLKSKLQELADMIEKELNGRTRMFVDTGPLVEREAARRAGIGYIGKNCSLINLKHGSYIFIGEILTNIYIEPDDPVDNECGNCDVCIRACPTGALCSPYTVNARKCISYLTQSKDIRVEQHKSIGNNLYGCDVCQNVCPKNKDANISRHKEFVPGEWNLHPDAVDILDMNNKDFENTFKKTSSGWRGKKTLQRNAIIVLGNSGNKDAAQYIKRMLSDSRRDMREISIHALYNLLGRDSIGMLKEHYDIEKDEDIKELINSYIRLGRAEDDSKDGR